MRRARPQTAGPRSSGVGPTAVSITSTRQTARVPSAGDTKPSKPKIPPLSTVSRQDSAEENINGNQVRERSARGSAPSLRRPMSAVVPPREQYGSILDQPIRGATPSPEPAELTSSFTMYSRSNLQSDVSSTRRPQTARLYSSRPGTARARPQTARDHTATVSRRYRSKSPRGQPRAVDFHTKRGSAVIDLNLPGKGKSNGDISAIASEVNDYAHATWKALLEKDSKRLKGHDIGTETARDRLARKEREHNEQVVLESLRQGVQTLKQSEETIGASYVQLGIIDEKAVKAKNKKASKAAKKRKEMQEAQDDDNVVLSDGSDVDATLEATRRDVPNSRLYRPSELTLTKVDEDDFNARAPTLKVKRKMLEKKIAHYRENPTEVKKLKKRISRERRKRRYAACGSKTRDIIKDNVKAVKEARPEVVNAKRAERMKKHEEHSREVQTKRAMNREAWLHYKALSIAARKEGLPPPATPRWRNTSPVQSRRFAYQDDEYYNFDPATGEYTYFEGPGTIPTDYHDDGALDEYWGEEGGEQDYHHHQEHIDDDVHDHEHEHDHDDDDNDEVSLDVTASEPLKHVDWSSEDEGSDEGPLSDIDDADDEGRSLSRAAQQEDDRHQPSTLIITVENSDHLDHNDAIPRPGPLRGSRALSALPATNQSLQLSAPNRLHSQSLSQSALPSVKKSSGLSAAPSTRVQEPEEDSTEDAGDLLLMRQLSDGRELPVINFEALAKSKLMAQHKETLKKNAIAKETKSASDGAGLLGMMSFLGSFTKQIGGHTVPLDPTLIEEDGVPPPMPD